jgi:hypothetical protein
MDSDFRIGRRAFAKEFPFGYHAFCRRIPLLKKAGVILGPRLFGKPPNRRLMIYSKKSLIDRFLIENPNFKKCISL